MQNKRIRYSKEFKRKALLNIMQGEDALEVLKSSGFDLAQVLKNDKKYVSKIIHKWKKEIYQNKENMYLVNSEITNNILKEEILKLKDENEKDTVMLDLKDKISKNSINYKKLKAHILSLTFKKNKK